MFESWNEWELRAMYAAYMANRPNLETAEFERFVAIVRELQRRGAIE